MKALLFLLAVWGCLGMVQCRQEPVTPKAEPATDVAAEAGCLDPKAQPLIDELLQKPKANPAGEVWRYTWQGRTVFLVKSFHPDAYLSLYEVKDKQLRYVGAPSGGITGKGDRKCPTFYAEATDDCLMWRDPR